MYNMNQRQYLNWAEFLKDVSLFCPDFDYEKSFALKNYSFFKKDGQQVLAGSFAAYVQALKDEVGLNIEPRGCFDVGYTTTILFNDFPGDFTKAMEKQNEKVESDSLKSLTKAELLKLAEGKGLVVKPTLNKEQILALIEAK